MPDNVFYSRLSSPLGELLLTSDGQRLTGVFFPDHQDTHKSRSQWKQGARVLDEARRQLDAYFAGKLREFDVPLAMSGTDFERRVWTALQRIEYGVTVSYGHIARWIRQPTACRAVGVANGRNPIPIIVPCHRVIGSDGSLTGYGGGLETKRWLLEREGLVLSQRKSGWFVRAELSAV